MQHCRIELNDFPVTFDDKFYFSFDVAKNIPILCINASEANSESIYLNKLFGVDSLFDFNNAAENKLDYSTLPNNKLVILNGLKSISSGLAQELKRFINNGGSVFAIPGKDVDLNSYKDFFTTLKANYFERLDTVNTKVDKINLEHPIYKDVFDKKTFTATNLDLPIVSKHYVFSKNSRTNEEYLLKLQNGDVFLSKYDIENGKLYISSVDLNTDFSNFTKHAIFVPTLYKIGIYSQRPQLLFYTIGIDNVIELDKIKVGETAIHIRGINNNFDVIPELKAMESRSEIIVHDQINNAGNYNLFSEKELLTGLSFNFNRKESDLNCYNSDELTELVNKSSYSNFKILQATTQSLTQSLKEIEQGRKFWKLCLIFALIFLAIEVLLLRLMK